MWGVCDGRYEGPRLTRSVPERELFPGIIFLVNTVHICDGSDFFIVPFPPEHALARCAARWLQNVHVDTRANPSALNTAQALGREVVLSVYMCK